MENARVFGCAFKKVQGVSTIAYIRIVQGSKALQKHAKNNCFFKFNYSHPSVFFNAPCLSSISKETFSNHGPRKKVSITIL